MTNQTFKDKTRDELIIIASNGYASLQSLSKLYLDSKTENKFLGRRNHILETRLNYLKNELEKKNGCNITFDRIDALIKKGRKIKCRPKVHYR